MSCAPPEYRFRRYSYYENRQEHQTYGERPSAEITLPPGDPSLGSKGPHPSEPAWGWDTGGRLTAWHGRKLPGPVFLKGLGGAIALEVAWHAHLLAVLGWDVEEAGVGRSGHSPNPNFCGTSSPGQTCGHIVLRLHPERPVSYYCSAIEQLSWRKGKKEPPCWLVPTPDHIQILADVEVREKEVRWALRLRGAPTPERYQSRLPLSEPERQWGARLLDDVWAQRAPKASWADFLPEDYPEIRQWGEDLADVLEILIGQAKWGLLSPLDRLGYVAEGA